MAGDQTSETTIRLNVLGPLEIALEPGGAVALPTSLRARHVLVVMAIEPQYRWRGLIEILWPEEARTNADRVRDALDNRLSKDLGNARRAFGLDRDSGFLYAHSGTVRRVNGDCVTVISDSDEFRRLAATDDRADLYAALALVRGVVATHLPDISSDAEEEDWLAHQRQLQRKDIIHVLERLHPDASREDLEALCQDVLDRRYQPDESIVPEQQSRVIADTPPLADPEPVEGKEPPETLLMARSSLMIATEVGHIFTVGIADALSQNLTPTLEAISQVVYPLGGATVEKIEALLSWACGEYGYDSADRLAALELAGLGMERGLSATERCSRALKQKGWSTDPDHLGTFKEKANAVIGVTAYHMSESLWKLGTSEGVDCGPPAYKSWPAYKS